jgi:hypothetical protein
MKQWTAVTVALVLAGTAGAGISARGEDDLAIVKKAVASPAPARARESRSAATSPARATTESGTVAQTAPPAAETRPLARTGREPQWFKVRVVERNTGRKRVTINLPLSLVRALGDDTIDWGCRNGERDREKCHSVRLSEVLRSLEAGQELVEIEDDEATVKVWVE